MMRIKENLFYRSAVLGTVIPLLFSFCAKKKDSQVIIIGSESLTVEQLVKLDPVAPSDSVRIRNLKLRKAVASETADTGVDSLAKRFSEQLQLRAGEKWTPKGAGLLLSSGRVLYRKLNELSSSKSVAAYAESLFTQYKKGDSSGPGLTAALPDSIKLEKQNTYFKAPSGGPLVQHSLVAMLEFCRKGILTPEQVVDKMCHAPAMLFKINRRGFIRKGYFADLVIVDPNDPWTVGSQNLLYKCGWSPLEGMTFSSRVTHTFVNGTLVYDNGNFVSSQKGMRLVFDRPSK